MKKHPARLLYLAFALMIANLSAGQGFRLPSHQPSGASPEVTDMKVYDREGRAYDLSELRFSNDQPVHKTTGIAGTYDAGIFRLHFDDAGTNVGFDDPALGPQRVGVAVQVFTDLSGLINEAASPYSNVPNLGTGPSFVEIHVLSSVNNAADPTLAIAGQFFLTTSPGIVYGSVWQTINSGIDAWSGITGSNIGNTGIYHGLLQANFGHSFYLGTSTSGIGASEVDLYSVMLHESMHALGIGSLIAQNGNSKLTNSNPGVYGFYDTWLTNNSGASLINWNGCYSAAFNTAYTSQLTSPCTFKFNGTNPLAISSDATWSSGTSLSHFPAACGNGGSLVMNPSMTPGTTKRFPDLQEVTALCNLGYSTSGIFPGTNYPASGTCGNRVAGVNDYSFYNASGTGASFTTPANTAFAFTGNDLLGNDEGANWYSCLEVVNQSGTIAGASSGNTTNSISFMPNAGFAGTAILKYIPKESATGKSGNISYIFIDVQPPPLPPCVQNSPCELVCYGGFEEFTSQAQYDLYTYGGFTTSNASAFFFYPATYPDNSPDFHNISYTQADIVSCGQNNIPIGAHAGIGYIGMILRNDPFTGANNPEGPAFPLASPVYPGESVNVSFWARLASSSCNGGIEVRLTSMAPCMNAITLANCPGLVQTPVVASGALASNINWQQFTIPITNNTPVPMTHLMLNSLPYTAYTAIPFGFIFLDDVSCIKNVPVFTVTNTGPASACMGDTVTYDMTVTNTGNTIALNVLLKDSLSQGLTYVSGGSFTYPQQTIASLAQGASQSFTVKAVVTSSFGSQFNALNLLSGACISSSSNSIANTEINNQVLNIAATLIPDAPCPGDLVQLHLDVCNPGFDTVQNISLKTIIPAGYTAMAGTGYSLSGGDIVWNSFTLSPGTITTPTCVSLTADVQLGTTSENICTNILSGDHTCQNQVNCVNVNFDSCGTQGINEPGKMAKLSYYPNPASDIVSFEIDSRNPGILTLYDIAGKKILSRAVVKGRQKIVVGLQSFSAGLYQFRLTHNGTTIQAGKFIITR